VRRAIGQRRGLTLIEIMVALLLLTVGALALAAGIASGERARREAVTRGLALAAAETWLETWRGAPWSGDSAGISPVAWAAWRGELRWRTSGVAPCLVEARVAAGREGRAPTAVLVTRRFREGEPGCGP
jgi:prepilin-type N-terminal cleavage/methylation domain-containing protein